MHSFVTEGAKKNNDGKCHYELPKNEITPECLREACFSFPSRDDDFMHVLTPNNASFGITCQVTFPSTHLMIFELPNVQTGTFLAQDTNAGILLPRAFVHDLVMSVGISHRG